MGRRAGPPGVGRTTVSEITQAWRIRLSLDCMTFTRLAYHDLRSGVMLLAGCALIAIPLLVAWGAAPILFGVVVGAAAVALALSGTAPAGRGTLPLTAQAVYDRGLAVGLIAAAIVFGLAGESGAPILFAAAGATMLAVASITRYSARPA